jgi:large subunit ribosomal protein L15
MRIGELKAPPGATKKRKRIGRGPGSGHGKTSTRGHKGQKARSGGKVSPWSEGGQMPLQRRLPKRGFTNIFKKEYQIVNLGSLEKCLGQETINSLVLKNFGLIKKLGKPIKILAQGELKFPCVIQAHSFSEKAKEKILAIGGKFEVVK